MQAHPIVYLERGGPDGIPHRKPTYGVMSRRGLGSVTDIYGISEIGRSPTSCPILRSRAVALQAKSWGERPKRRWTRVSESQLIPTRSEM